MLKVYKRNGSTVDFEKSKIENAVNNALFDVDGILYETDTAKSIADDIEKALLDFKKINPNYQTSVEDIQDMVEQLLMASERKDVAKAYIRYRYRREIARTYNEDFVKAIADKIEVKDKKNQNANVDEESFGGRMGEAQSVLMKKYGLDFCISKQSRELHEKNLIYIHDLDSYAVGMHNCLTIPFDKLLKNGFNTRNIDIRPTNSVGTAFQLVAVIFQLESLQQFGGVSASHLDWTMVPFVRKSFRKHYIDGLKYIENIEDKEYFDHIPINAGIEDKEYKERPQVYHYAIKMTEKEVHQAVEGMYHNLNTLQSRSGNQLPFTSINYGTCTSPEGRMITRALLEVSIEGLGRHHRTSIFPCGIFQVMSGVNKEPGTPNYDLYRLALESTGKRLYPNYANVDWSGNAGYDRNDPATYFSTMGCRTANGWDVNGFGQLKDGRGNICPVTIIMPEVAMEAIDVWKKNPTKLLPDKSPEENLIELFLSRLDTMIDYARQMLLERFQWICSQSPKSAKFLYENGLMAGYIPEEGIYSAMKHGTLAIGQLGLAETLQLLIQCDHTTDKGMDLAKRIESLFKKRCAEFKEKYKLNFGVYYTPAENLCHTAMDKFKNKHGIIKDVSDKEFFTNSIHVPVWKNISPFDKIDIESQLTGYSSAGCITYVELESGVKNNVDALEQIVTYAMDHDIPYFAVNVPNDTCLTCGFTDEFNDHCPECGSPDIQQLRRVTGYLTGNYTSAFNKGKQQEVEMRVKHK